MHVDLFLECNQLRNLFVENYSPSKDKIFDSSMKIPDSSLSFNVPQKTRYAIFPLRLSSFLLLKLLSLRQMCQVVQLSSLATDPSATVNDGSCDNHHVWCWDAQMSALVTTAPAATINDGSCDYLSCLVPGCTLANACNYDPDAEVNDGSCEYTSCAGCMNEFADNYDPTATVDDGSCNPIEGCTSPQACNFIQTPTAMMDMCDFLSCLATGCTNELAA